MVRLTAFPSPTSLLCHAHTEKSLLSLKLWIRSPFWAPAYTDADTINILHISLSSSRSRVAVVHTLEQGSSPECFLELDLRAERQQGNQILIVKVVDCLTTHKLSLSKEGDSSAGHELDLSTSDSDGIWSRSRASLPPRGYCVLGRREMLVLAHRGEREEEGWKNHSRTF